MNGVLAGDIRRIAAAAFHGLDGAGVDDLTMPQRNHLTGNLPGEKEQGAKVHLHHGVKVLHRVVLCRGELDDAGVVDQNIHLAEGGERLLCNTLCRVSLRKVRPDFIGAAALGFHQGLGVAHTAQPNAHNVGPSPCQGNGHGLSKPPAYACDQRRFSLQGEE